MNRMYRSAYCSVIPWSANVFGVGISRSWMITAGVCTPYVPTNHRIAPGTDARSVV